MKFSEKCVELHCRFFSGMHAFPSSGVAFLCHISSDPRRAWKPAALAEKFGHGYASAANIMRRLRLEGFIDASGRITARGLAATGHAPIGEIEEVF